MERKKAPATLFVMLTVVAAIIPERGLDLSLYWATIEREQLEILIPVQYPIGFSDISTNDNRDKIVMSSVD